MRGYLACVLAAALCACGSSSSKTTTDAADERPAVDGLPDLHEADLGPDTPVAGPDAGQDEPAPQAKDASPLDDGAGGPANDAPDGRPDVTTVPSDSGVTDGRIEVSARDGTPDGLAQTDGRLDAAPGLDGKGETGTPRACSSFDECECLEANGCAPIAEGCWCPEACGVVCGCGGGRYVGCAPIDRYTCAGASKRVASLCPDVAAEVEALCSSGNVCAIKCLNEVETCDDISCTTCKDCKCKQDDYGRCVEECNLQLRDASA